MVIWLVGLVGMKSIESLSPKVTIKLYQFPTKNVQVMAFLNFLYHKTGYRRKKKVIILFGQRPQRGDVL